MMQRVILTLSHILCILIREFIMKSILKKIILVSVLSTYIGIGVLGHLEVLSFLGWQSTNSQIVSAKSDPLPATKVYWTQNKHIPSTVKISVPSPAVFAPPETPHVCMHGIVFTQDAFNIISDSSFFLHSSRAPPRI